MCADAGGWTELQPCGDIAAVCTVLHQSQLTAASEQVCPLSVNSVSPVLQKIDSAIAPSLVCSP